MQDTNIAEGINKNNIYNKFRKLKTVLLTLLILCFVFSGITGITNADSTTSLTVVVNYDDEIAYISPGSGGSTKYYMSTDAMKTWEMIDTSGTVDLSPLLSSKEVTLYFKGNKDGNPRSVVLQAEDAALKPVFTITSGYGSISYNAIAGVTVEYKKGTNGDWKPAPNNMPTAIYEIKGTTLYYRTAGTTVKRAGKVAAVKIPKRPAAPSVKLDGNKLSITGMKSGVTQYRVGDAAGWSTFDSGNSKINYIFLSSLLGVTSVNAPIPAGIIEFRTMGTDKKLSSAVRVIEVPVQTVCPDTVVLSGSTLSIADTIRKTYEFTVVKNGSVLNQNTAKWTSVTLKNGTFVKNIASSVKGLAIGDKIYVRVKSYTDSTTKKPVLASTYKELTVTSLSTN